MEAITSDYQFSAQPRIVKAKIMKYRNQEENARSVNIMIDRRIVRGNTFASMIIPSSTQQEIEKKQEQDRKKFSQIQPKENFSSKEEVREIDTPDAVQGRQHIHVQTENIPEELSEKPIEHGKEAQTDYYIDRPPSPLFILKKIGEDIETQVNDGEFFDFDNEVDPILEVLVCKTLEIGRMEVLEEEELNAIKEHQKEFNQKRKIKLNELQRIEGEQIRKKEEGNSRRIEAKTKKENMQFAHKKYISRIMAKKFLSKLSGIAFQDLQSLGTYNNIQETSMHDQLYPWIINTTASSLENRNTFTEFFSLVLHESFINLKDLHVKALQNEKSLRENERLLIIQQEKEEEDRKAKRIQMRIQKKRNNELNSIRARIEKRIDSEGVLIDKALSNIFSDIDGRQTEKIIGTPGGLFGELVNILSIVEEMLSIKITQDQMNAILLDFLAHMECPLLIYNNISEDKFDEFIKSIGKQGLTFDKLYALEEEIKSLVLSFLLNIKNAAEDTSLTIIWKHLNEFGIRDGLIESIIIAFFNILAAKDVNTTNFNQDRLKVELKPIKLNEHKEIAVIRIAIPLNEHGVLEEVESFEDKVMLINPSNNEFSFFIIHQDAQRILRNDLAHWIKTTKIFEMIDVHKLKSTLNIKSLEREQKLLAIIAKGLPIFDILI